MAMRKCTSPNKRHKWQFVKNATRQTQTLTQIHFSTAGRYKCVICHCYKWGLYDPNHPITS